MSWFDQLDIGSLLKDSGLNELVEEASNFIDTANRLDILHLDTMAILDEENEKRIYEDETDSDDDRDGDGTGEEVTYHDNYDDRLHITDESSGSSDSKVLVKVNSVDPTSSQQSHQVQTAPPIQVYITATAPYTEPPDVGTHDSSQLLENECIVHPAAHDDVDSMSLDKIVLWDEIELKPSGISNRPRLTKDARSSASNMKGSNELSSFVSEIYDVSLVSTDGEESYPLGAQQRLMDRAAETPLVDVPMMVSQQLQIKEVHDSQAAGAVNHTSPPIDKPAVKTSKQEMKSDSRSVSNVKRIKPLKRNERKPKGLDFFGVSTTVTKAPAVVSTSVRTSEVPSEGSTAPSSSLRSTDSASGAVAIDIRRTSVEFFGPIGILGDDTFTRDDHGTEEPIHSSERGTEVILPLLADVITDSNAMSTSTASSAVASVQDSFRVFIRVSASSSNNFLAGSSNSSNPSWISSSFFDKVDEEVSLDDDPILRQVELNKSSASTRESNMLLSSKALEMLYNLWGSSEEESNKAPPVDSTAPSGRHELSVLAVERDEDGSPACWKTILAKYSQLTQLSVKIMSTDSVHCLHTFTPIDEDVNNCFYVVQLEVPSSSVTSIFKCFVQLLILLVMSIVSVLVILCKLACRTTASCMQSTWSQCRQSGGADGGRLRRFFARDETVDAVLGRNSSYVDRSQELTWYDRVLQPLKYVALLVWNHIDSTNGITMITAVLFVLSYYKFQRYGTDAGD